MIKISRRDLLVLAGSTAIAGLVGYRKIKSYIQPKKIPGNITGASFSRGHLIRDPKFDAPIKNFYIDTLIVGAGISGLSAGYHLNEMGFTDYKIIDLEKRVGGNSSSGKNEAGMHPLGAHYIPILSEESYELKDFFKKIGVIKHETSNGPEYNEYYLCSELSERIFLDGRWHEGLIPSSCKNEEFDRFFSLMKFYKNARGSDGKRAFALPLERSSQDEEFLKFDKMSMKDFLVKEKFQDPKLIWYVNYCCRDDYGATIDLVSAWAGIHYFASRNGQGDEVDSSDILTWPEGNAFFTNKFMEFIGEKVQLNTLVYEISKKEEGFFVKTYNFKSKKIEQYHVNYIIYSSPLFTANKVIKFPFENLSVNSAPWMTANILLNTPIESADVPVAWDNVNFHGKSLGYVVSNHQDLKGILTKQNITLYWPLLDDSIRNTRIKALKTTHQEWCEIVINELERIHPDITKSIESIDIALFGHAMSIPEVGFLHKRKKFSHKLKNLIFAHSDVSGISIFEQAFYQGHQAAKVRVS